MPTDLMQSSFGGSAPKGRYPYTSCFVLLFCLGVECPGKGTGDLLGQVYRIERFCDRSDDPQFAELLSIVQSGASSHQNHRNSFGRWIGLQFLKRGDSIHLRHGDIQQDGVWLLCCSNFQGFKPGTGSQHLPICCHFQAKLGYFQNIAGIINN